MSTLKWVDCYRITQSILKCLIPESDNCNATTLVVVGRAVAVLVVVGRVVIDVAFGIGLSAERPRLPRQAVIAVVDVLRALHRTAVGVQLPRCGSGGRGIVLKAVARKLARRIAVAQPCREPSAL